MIEKAVGAEFERALDAGAAAIDRFEEANGPLPAEARAPKPDPAPSMYEIAEKKAAGLVGDISSKTVAELRALRDEIDELIRTITDREATITAAIAEHAAFAASAIDVKSVVAETVKRLRAQIENGLPPGRPRKVS